MRVGGTWIEQPRKTRICGQIAVAVIADVPLEEVIEVIGHRNGTKSPVLSLALAHYGYKAPKRARALRVAPPLAIGQLRRVGRSGGGWHWHWVAIIDGTVFDGEVDGPRPLTWYRRDAEHRGWRITSYLPVL